MESQQTRGDLKALQEVRARWQDTGTYLHGHRLGIIGAHLCLQQNPSKLLTPDQSCLVQPAG